ncbi:ATP-grasp domain-containing protein [Actinophytocola sp.]|uniref:ATP-grasp domain-containing protein n=1 Tax=Actinophytocola sp. TaxID=1872138 RepID=UPI00389AE293
MAQARVLVLGCTAATPWTRDQLVRLGEQARRRGVRLVGADTRAGLAAAPMSRLSVVDETVAFDIHDPAAARRWARGRSDIDAVVTVQELCVLPAAEIAEELGLPGNDPDVVRGIRTKDLCRERLRSAGFPQPRVAVCASRREAEAFMLAHRGPWVVKPRDGLASTGVTLVHDRAGLAEALAALDNVAASLAKFGARAAAGPREFLIETFVRGTEFSAEGVLVGGVPRVLAVTEKRTDDSFIETGHRVAPVTDPALAAAADTVARAVTAAGVTHGAFHVEFWRTPHGVVLGEVHARPGGDYIHALVEHSRPGLELYGLLVDDLLGRAPAPVPPQTRAAGAEFLLLPPGHLRAVHGWAEVAAHPEVLAADLWVRPGREVGRVTDNLDRHGVIVAAGGDEVLAGLRRRLVVDVHEEAAALAA